MSAATWGLVVPAKGDPITPFRTPFSNMAESIATALDKVNTQSFPRYAKRSDLPSTNNLIRQHATVYADPTAANNGDYYWNGTTWAPIGLFAVAAGQASTNDISNGATKSVNISFPSGRFSQIPRLLFGSGHSRITMGYTTISTTGATINFSNFSGGPASGNITCDWEAVQMSSASANG